MAPLNFRKKPVNSAFTGFRLLIALDSSREDRIRTCDPYVPNVVRYRAALLPEEGTQKYGASAIWQNRLSSFLDDLEGVTQVVGEIGGKHAFL